MGWTSRTIREGLWAVDVLDMRLAVWELEKGLQTEAEKSSRVWSAGREMRWQHRWSYPQSNTNHLYVTVLPFSTQSMKRQYSLLGRVSLPPTNPLFLLNKFLCSVKIFKNKDCALLLLVVLRFPKCIEIQSLLSEWINEWNIVVWQKSCKATL